MQGCPDRFERAVNSYRTCQWESAIKRKQQEDINKQILKVVKDIIGRLAGGIVIGVFIREMISLFMQYGGR